MNRVELFYRLNRLPEVVFLGSRQDARRDRHDLLVVELADSSKFLIHGITWQISYGFNFVRKADVHGLDDRGGFDAVTSKVQSHSSTMFTTNRKGCYKLPPTTISDKLVSQETRRSKVLHWFLFLNIFNNSNSLRIRLWKNRNASVPLPHSPLLLTIIISFIALNRGGHNA